MNALDEAGLVRATEIVRSRGEPLPIEVLAQRFYEEEQSREILPYQPVNSYLVGQRVSWQTPSYGRLIGVITSLEFVSGRWRILVDWDSRLSPGLARYQANRSGSRLAYLIDPMAAAAARDADDATASADEGGPTVAQLLEQDLEDALRGSDRFSSWAGLWAPVELLPAISEADLETACAVASLDDGIAQTNQILELLHLPGPENIGHGFAALAVNRRIQHDRRWVWGGPRDGGQWLPGHTLSAAGQNLGPVPRLEEDMRIMPIPDLRDNELPDELGELVGEVTIRGLDVEAHGSSLDHVLSRWERRHGVFAFDAVEMTTFPRQAVIPLLWGEVTSTALLLPDERVLMPELEVHRDLVRQAARVHFERLGSTDEFAVSLESAASPTEFDRDDEGDFMLRVTSAFADGMAHDARFVIDHVRTFEPGDLAVLTRAVAAVLAGYACFEPAPGEAYRYLPLEPHRPTEGVRMTTIPALAAKSARARVQAVEEDRQLRRSRAEGPRSGHMVRGHLRRVQRDQGSPVQVALARMHGIDVPRGYTFVRPHERH